MSNNPLVSVILNNYNYEKFLPEAIESVINQTYKNFELIIVDDGSTDKSRNIIDSYYNMYKDLIVPIYKENGGQASAFNVGYAASRGEVICFLDSDDYWFPDKIEKILPYHSDYGIVQHNLLINGERKYLNLHNDVDWQMLLKEYGYVCAFIPTSGISCTRFILDKVFPLPERNIKLGADAYVRWMSMYFSPIYSIDMPLGYYRAHGGNIFYNKFSGEDVRKMLANIKNLINDKLASQSYPQIPFDKKGSYVDLIVHSTTIKRGESYLLYGAGTLGERFTNLIEEKGGFVKLFSDTNEKRWWSTFMGRQIIPPGEIKNYRKSFDKILISSSYVSEIVAYLEELGYEKDKDIIMPRIL